MEALLTENPRAFLPGTIHSFLSAFPRESEYFERWRALLEKQILNSDSKIAGRLRDQQSRWGHFSFNGPENVAERVLTKRLPPSNAISEIFHDREPVQGPFLDHFKNALAKSIEENLRLDKLDATSLDLVLPYFLSGERLRTWRIPLAIALLNPYVAEYPRDEALKQSIERFLIQNIGDPRSAPDRWMDVPEDCRFVLMRWLVRRSFERFFDVIGKGVQNQPISREQWERRRIYWGNLVERGVVTEAWPVFGPAAARLARSMRIPDSEYGTIVDPTSRSSSAFVMRLRGIQGSIIAVEWSDNGALRGWRSDDTQAPSLYRNRYTEDIIRPQRNILFREPHLGSWEQKFSRTIVSHVGRPI